MAQSIKNLTLGSKVIDENGNSFIVIAKNHYMSNSVLLWAESIVTKLKMSTYAQSNADFDYSFSNVEYYLRNDYPKILGEIKNYVLDANIKYSNVISSSQAKQDPLNAKYFILGFSELGGSYAGNEGSHISYFTNSNRREKESNYWTRTEFTASLSTAKLLYIPNTGDVLASNTTTVTSTMGVVPAFNVSTDLLVSNEVSNGYYTMIFSEPPIINTIGNIKGNYGSNTKITYTATDNDDAILNHYISFDNGGTWSKIDPSKVGDTYTYTHVFNELKKYACRVKVVDSAGNETVSNMFIVEVSSTAPSINIVNVIDKVITFKVNCITDEISKVEVLINDVVKKTYTNNFDFNLVYEINSADIKVGDNKVEIKATSSANIVNTKYLEVSKKSYDLPPVGTKVLINEFEYSITKTSNNGSTHTYTLDKNLLTNLKANDIVRVMQDRVNVKCSLSNVSANKDFKDMKLVKSKVLKGDFEGYIEEKYELEGEGRYSTIRLELERFNSNSKNEIIELQQAFDYLED